MKVYNDLTRREEELSALEEGHFKIYVCGPTVYDLFHLGNARPFIVYDTLRRYLEYRGNKVTYVQNFTDIDDKMIQRASAEGITVKELADKMIAEYFQDADGLNIKRASHHPRATECIDDIIDMIKILEDKGFAYVADDGVYFETEKFDGYGKLSHRNLDDQEEGASQRLELTGNKRGPQDFVMWKFKKEGEPAWPSPWGEGRPGWHIECSAMNKRYLGKTVDIHGGGMDLIFPHHENEIAQSEAANDAPFVRYWMHNGFINVDFESIGFQKMSKSKGNFFTVRELVKDYPYEVLRFFMLQTHYRMPIGFSPEHLEAARSGLDRIKTCLANIEFILDKPEDLGEEVAALSEAVKTCEDHFNEAMDNDLNTPDAFAAIFELVRLVNTLLADQLPTKGQLASAQEVIIRLCEVLGLELASKAETIPAEVNRLLQDRTKAKEDRDFAKADQLRDEILALGYRVEDTTLGPKLVSAED